MELRNTQGTPLPERRPESAKLAARGMEGLGEALADVRQRSRAEIEATETGQERATVLSRAAHEDSVDLSTAARLFTSDDQGMLRAREELVSELRSAYQNGDLNTTERMERAAERLLGKS